MGNPIEFNVDLQPEYKIGANISFLKFVQNQPKWYFSHLIKMNSESICLKLKGDLDNVLENLWGGSILTKRTASGCVSNSLNI